MFYQCPVCGYGLLRVPPSNHSICPCCATEFGYDDFSRTHRKLRNEWLAAGAPWFSSSTFPPPMWNGFRQVIEAGFPFDVPAPITPNRVFTIRVPAFVQRDLQVEVS